MAGSMFIGNRCGVSRVIKWHKMTIITTFCRESIRCIYQSCLNSEEFISKVIDMITSHSFMGLSMHNRKVRNEFIGLFQTYFESMPLNHFAFESINGHLLLARVEVQQQSAVAFRRSVRILGEFYNKARLCDGSPIQVLVHPLVEYLEMLLKAAELEDLELFTAQVFNNVNNGGVQKVNGKN